MFALVDKSDNSITRMLNGNRGITLGDNQYPKAIFTLWTEAERNAINIYTVEMDNSKKKNEEWYNNTNITYSFDGSKVTGSYGDATAKAHADTLYTSQDKTDGKIPADKDVGDVKVEGLKTVLIRNVKAQAAGELSKTDWYITRKTEKDTAIPSAVSTHRDAVRSKQASMETSITNASDTPALETLYTYTEQEDGSTARPLGEIPVKEF
tara:strand:- start:455 stop:1081 length:627 start_codon:yes stop_codon:yes gene_type:complete